MTKFRRIKFRVFDLVSKSMHIIGEFHHDSMQCDSKDHEVFYYNYQCGEGSLTYDEEFPEDPDRNGGYILMQYIGINDQNNKEIYDGDILKIQENLYVVHWNEEAAGWYLRSNQRTEQCTKSICKQSFIIGNIYEKPELIKTRE